MTKYSRPFRAPYRIKISLKTNRPGITKHCQQTANNTALLLLRITKRRVKGISPPPPLATPVDTGLSKHENHFHETCHCVTKYAYIS
ncbi:hypothetical protein WN55_05121 [Dufourea novaeangliae]|uniref:Uncharacterized protein n=1 Tax=Dufourea novaeangliae TaxID=178035 RepID=A0A154PNY0_DUFNO|nr:hypothetical protein WN55_05121 [Dufourea novaeangliae]